MMALRVSHHGHVFQMPRLSEGRARLDEQGFGDDCDLRAAVVEEKTVVGATHEGVHRHGHRTQLHCAEEGGDEFRAIQENQEDTVLHLNAEVEESIANTVHGFEDFPIFDDAVLVVEGGSACTAFHDVTIDEEGRRIEPIRNRGGWLSHDLPGREWGAGPQEGCGGRRGKKPSGLAGFNGRILRKPEHVGLTSHGARAATRRVLRSGRPETMGLPGEAGSCRRPERARRTRRTAEAIRCRGPVSRGAATGRADSIFVHDPAIVTDGGALILRMGKELRRGEEASMARALRTVGVPVLASLQGEATAEGGDLLWVNRDILAVGQGFRTNTDGLRQIREAMKPIGVDVESVPLPYYRGPAACLHLMSLISILDDDLAVVYSRLLPVPFRQFLQEYGYEFVEVPNEEFETMAPNVLAVAPRDCIMLEGNRTTQERLKEAGCRVRTYRGKEISLKAEGGATCLTRPIFRSR